MYKLKKEVVENYCELNSMSRSKFSKECGLSPITMKKMFDGKEVKIIAFFKISRYINVGIDEIIE